MEKKNVSVSSIITSFTVCVYIIKEHNKNYIIIIIIIIMSPKKDLQFACRL